MSASAAGAGLIRLARAAGRHLRAVPVEAAVWTAGLALMAAMDPATAGPTACLFDQLGAEWCPGCGLGHAVAYLARGEVAASVQAHPLGIPAVAILTGHIGRLVLRGRAGARAGTARRNPDE
jgi:hypothetical protein